MCRSPVTRFCLYRSPSSSLNFSPIGVPSQGSVYTGHHQAAPIPPHRCPTIAKTLSYSAGKCSVCGGHNSTRSWYIVGQVLNSRTHTHMRACTHTHIHSLIRTTVSISKSYFETKYYYLCHRTSQIKKE